jgi:hypothetical protein
MAAKSRLARVYTSNATNPTFGFTTLGEEFSFGESAAYIIVLGDHVSGTVPKSWVEYLFGEILGRTCTSHGPKLT